VNGDGDPVWATLDAATKRIPAVVCDADIPTGPGVYAWYRAGKAVYVGKASSLRSRLWRQHLGQSRSLHNSAFRRNVAESLGFGSANDLYEGRVVLDAAQLAKVREWITGCTLAWLECPSHAEAVTLETALKIEYRPILTKQ
jgi:hypothetical protein